MPKKGRKSTPPTETQDEMENRLDKEEVGRLLDKETSAWGSTSDELRTQGEEAEERATRTLRNIRNRSFKPGKTKF